LAALKAINAYLLSKGWTTDELPQSIDHYRIAIKQTIHSQKIMDYMNTAYENHHSTAYDRGGSGKGIIQEGCTAVRNIMEYYYRKLPS
jgi:hypothetical protein